MAHNSTSGIDDSMPVIAGIDEFDRKLGNRTEQFIFNNRALLVGICTLLTLVLGFFSLQLGVSASFDSMMPQSQEFIQNYHKHQKSLSGLGNSVRIVVANTKGNIYDAEYIQTLKEINDKVFLIPGVDRSFMKSLWMPVVRWVEITPDGWQGGAVMPDKYDGSQESIEALRLNVARGGLIGSLVANDQTSSMIVVPLIDHDPVTGKSIDYKGFRDQLEALRSYENKGVSIHIIGFAQLIGDLINGLNEVLTYFLYAALIAVLTIFAYTRCWRSTAAVISCSIVAVVWQLGLMQILGFSLDPYSTLVPFLIFAIGVSHGSQKMNGIMQDVGRGTHKYIAARYTFRRLFLAGVTALLADAVGFAVLAVIDIPSIRILAIAASIGVAVLIFTNLILLPIVLSFVGVSKSAAAYSLRSMQGAHPIVKWLARFSETRWAVGAIAIGLAITIAGGIIGLKLQIGDLDRGAPELRQDSTYNQDNDYITDHYKLSSDQFAVIVSTPEQGLISFETLLEMDRLEQILRDLPSVQTTVSPASLARQATSGIFEGAPKWETINRNISVVGDAMEIVHNSNNELFDGARSVAPIIVYLADHKAATLTRVVETVEAFALKHNTSERKFLLAAGTSGVEAATNIAVKMANQTMLLYIYASVILLCFTTFRSWRAVVVAIVPLIATTIMCEALMVILSIGVKVATLPVTALGVGIGVDYSLYLLTVQLAFQRKGYSVRDAYVAALISTGKVVALIGVTLSAAVVTWVWSPIKFQADMGMLLAFAFLWNMLGALILIPSLSRFLLNNKVAIRTGASVEKNEIAV